MDSYSVNALASSIGILILAILPVIQDRRNKLYLSLFCLNMATALWLFELYLLRTVPDADAANLVSRIFRPFMLSVPILLYNFVLTFTKWNGEGRLRFTRRILMGTTLLGILLGLFGIGVEGLVYKEGSGYYAKMDITYYIFLFNVISGVGTALYLMVKKYMDKTITPVERKQLQYLTLGIFMAVSAGLVTMLRIIGFNVVLIGPYGNLAYFILTTYAILSFDLLNIRELLQKTLMYASTAVMITGIFVLADRLIFPLINEPAYRNIIIFCLILLATVALNPTLKLMDRLTKRVFFISNYDYQTLLAYVINEFRAMKNIEELLDAAVKNVSGILKLSSTHIFYWDDIKKKYAPHSAGGGERELLEEKHPAAEYLRLKKDVVFFRNIYDDMAYRLGGKEEYRGIDIEKLAGFLKKYGAELCLPVVVNGGVSGFWIIGEKKNRETLRVEEINWLKNVVAQVSVMIENINLYGQLMHSERLVMLGEMAAAVAHEIRNPLTGLSSFIQMINEGQGQKEKILDRFLKIAPPEFKRLERLTDNLLALSHNTRLKIAGLSLNRLVKETLELLAHVLKKNKVETEEIFETIPDIKADREQVQQVIMNLLVNAVQAMPAGGKIIIRTGLKKINETSEIFLSIKDSGAGIAPEIKSKIFEPFFTTKAEGTGLGLAICRNIMQAHGGSIDAETAADKGSVFVLRFLKIDEGS